MRRKGCSNATCFGVTRLESAVVVSAAAAADGFCFIFLEEREVELGCRFLFLCGVTEMGSGTGVNKYMIIY